MKQHLFKGWNRGKVMGQGGAAASPLLTNLIYYYKFDGNANDAHTNHLNLSDVNTPTYTAGLIGQGANITTINRYSHDHDNLLDVGASDAEWIFWTKFNTVANGYIIRKANVPSSQGYSLGVDSGKAYIFGYFGGTLKNKASPALSTDTWYMWDVYFDSTNQLFSVAINCGAFASVATANGTLTAASSSILDIRGSSDLQLEEVGFWKRLLTAQERIDLYNGGAGLTYPF